MASSLAIAGVTLVLGSLSSPGMGLLFALAALIVAVPIALVHGLVLAVPTYLLMHRRVALSRRNAMLAGFAIAAVPIALVNYLPLGAPYEGPIGEQLAQRIGLGGFSGIFGAVGSLTFRRLLRALDPEARA
jgi:hypothetical protein